MKGVIVTGTDTGIGKTVLAAGVAGALRGRYWKPVQAGLDGETDSDCVRRLAPDAQVLAEGYRLVTPCSPHQAAAIDGVRIAEERLALPEGEGALVVEGAGGALVPLRDDLLFADMFARWGLPVVVAARTSLGTINHTLMTLEALRARGCVVAGVAFVGEEVAESEAAICRIGGVRRLGRLPMLAPLDAGSLAAAMAGFDLEGLA